MQGVHIWHRAGAWGGTVLMFSCLSLRRHTQHSPGDSIPNVAVLEKMLVAFALLSREVENVSTFNSDSPEGVAAVHPTCEHMGTL